MCRVQLEKKKSNIAIPLVTSEAQEPKVESGYTVWLIISILWKYFKS